MTKVLIIDDRDDERYLLRRRLKKIDATFVITEASDTTCAEGVLSDPALAPDVVFLDVHMPIVSGIDFLPRFASIVNAHAHLTSVAVFMYTSSVDPADEAAAKSHEFVRAFLDKDADLESMRARLNAALD